jgi:hypothetical protein
VLPPDLHEVALLLQAVESLHPAMHAVALFVEDPAAENV